MRDQDIADLITMTLSKVGKGRFEQIAQQLNDYEVMSWLLNKNGMFGGVQEIDGGKSIKEQLMTEKGSAFRWVGLYDKDSVNVTEYMTEMEVNWCHATTNMAYERREILENRGEQRINNILVPRRVGMMLDVADRLGQLLRLSRTKEPGSRRTDRRKNSAQAPCRAQRVHDRRGVDPTVYPTFQNYTDSYAAVSKEDLIRRFGGHTSTPAEKPCIGQGVSFGNRHGASSPTTYDGGDGRNRRSPEREPGRDPAPYDEK